MVLVFRLFHMRIFKTITPNSVKAFIKTFGTGTTTLILFLEYTGNKKTVGYKTIVTKIVNSQFLVMELGTYLHS